MDLCQFAALAIGGLVVKVVSPKILLPAPTPTNRSLYSEELGDAEGHRSPPTLVDPTTEASQQRLHLDAHRSRETPRQQLRQSVPSPEQSAYFLGLCQVVLVRRQNISETSCGVVNNMVDAYVPGQCAHVVVGGKSLSKHR